MTLFGNFARASGLLLTIYLTPLAVSAETELDTLFAALQSAETEEQARDYENRIWLRWFEAGNAEIDELMQQAMSRRRNYDFNGALDVIDQVIAIDPDYAEAWNQRATVYFHQQEYEKSLEAVAKTLELEPRHFGAMAGRAVIRLQQMKPALARQNVLEALKLHPYLKERVFFPDLNNP